MTGQDRQALRRQFGELALDIVRRRGIEVTLAVLASEAGVSLARMDAIFESDDDLFDAVTEIWYAPLIAIMEDVLASELPANRKLYEFFARRFAHTRAIYREDPAYFRLLCELGGRRFEQVRSYVDLADHYTCEIIAEAQAEGYFEGLSIDRALTLINQMVIAYTMPDMLTMIDERLSEEKLAAIIDTLFAGLSARDGGAKGVAGLRAA